jgi:hypothetical protein
MAGMSRRVARAASAALVAAGILALGACENSLLDYLYKGLFYDGWKVASWSAPAPVVDGFTHDPDDTYSNGFPMNMAMGPSGKLHLIGYLVNTHWWAYTSMAAGADSFTPPYNQFKWISNPGKDIGAQPGMDLLSDDVLFIAYADNNRNLYYQECSSGSWNTAQVLYTEPTYDIGRAFVFYLLIGSDFEPHIFYVSNKTLFHTRRVNPTTIDPLTPESYISDVGSVRAIRLGTGELHFVWSDYLGQKLYHRTFTDSTVSEIWSNTDATLSIGEIALDNDLDGNLHVVFGTYKTGVFADVASATLHYLTNAGGSWQEKESITGNSTQGPMAFAFPASIDVARDKNGNDRLHLAFTMYKPLLTFYLWYAYHDEAGWNMSDTSLDTVNANSFSTFPILAVDPKGVVHIVYCWAVAETDRTMMYVRGTPKENQQ